MPSLALQLQNSIAAGLFDDIVFNGYLGFRLWIKLLSEAGLGDARLDSFMGGPRRDVALILPNWEVKVFMRWKGFLGRHVMHCHWTGSSRLSGPAIPGDRAVQGRMFPPDRAGSVLQQIFYVI